MDALGGTYTNVVVEAQADLPDMLIEGLAATADVAIIVSQGAEVDDDATALFHRMHKIMQREPLIMLLDTASKDTAAA